MWRCWRPAFRRRIGSRARSTRSAWRASTPGARTPAPGLRRPIELDATSRWPLDDGSVDLVLAINLLHLLPEGAIDGFLGEAGRVLGAGGCLALYAPLRDGDEYFSPGNRAFDAALRRSRPDLGLRDMGVIAAQALRHGLHLHRRIAMPANNHFLVLHAGAGGPAAA